MRIIARQQTGEMRLLHIVDRNFSRTNVNDGEAVVSVVGRGGEGAEEIALSRGQKGFFHEGSGGNQADNCAVEHRTLALLPALLRLRRGLAIIWLHSTNYHLIADSHLQTPSEDFLQVVVDCEVGYSAQWDISAYA